MINVIVIRYMVSKRGSSDGFFKEVLIEFRCNKRVKLDEKQGEIEDDNSPGQGRCHIEQRKSVRGVGLMKLKKKAGLDHVGPANLIHFFSLYPKLRGMSLSGVKQS